jgi:DNA-binding winged helix-turn-helix (wHTH) protein/TolB-like protein/Tfp pilus assembly protein PilF
MDAFAVKNPVYRFGDFELEAGRRILRLLPANTVVALTPRAFDLLLEFLRRPQQLVSKAELMAALWPDTVVEENNLDHAVFTLRQALGDRQGELRYIKTIHRRGYQFTMPVRLDSAPVEAHPAPSHARQRTRHGRIAIIALVSALALAIGLGVMVPVRRPPAATAASQAILAVRQFRSSTDDAARLLADAVTLLLEHRFSAITSLPVIAPDSTRSARNIDESSVAFGRRLGARFVLSGEIARSGQQLHLSATLTDASSGTELWSQVFERPVADITTVREEIAARAVEAMRIAPAVNDPAATAPVDLGVYELYVQCERLMGARALPADAEKATVLFTRTTVLDPRFARGYLGIAQALMYAHDMKPNLDSVQESDITRQARAAIDRALELNPGLGEAWIARARLVADEDQADEMFRRGLRLKPNYIVGAMFYYDFLVAHERTGEAIDVIHRARRLDPASPVLLWLEAVALMAGRSDVAASEQLLRQALELEGGEQVAAIQLALSLQHHSGQFAEAMRLMQRLPADVFLRASMAILYLDMDELQAAIDVWKGADPPPQFQLMVTSQYRRDTAAAAAVARGLFAASRIDGMAAVSLRDHAVATGDFAAALAVLEPAYARRPEAKTHVTVDHQFSIVFAHVLILSGQVERGRKLARELLVSLDGDEIGRPVHWFSRERAQLLAMLGENAKAIEALAADQRLNHWSRWWYTGELDPVFAPLRTDPGFQELVANARRQRAAQRALLADMIRRGEVRTVSAAR